MDISRFSEARRKMIRVYAESPYSHHNPFVKQLTNEDGAPYDFIGVDYTIFIKLTKLDSNTGI
jgi:hypothetical protein